MKLTIFFFLFISLLFVKPTNAATLTLSNVPPEKQIGEEFSISVSLQINQQNTDYYLRPLFYKEGSNSYSGCIKNNNNDWICNSQSDVKNYFKITTDNLGVWQGNIFLKGELETDRLKIRSYTANGSESTTSLSSNINIVATPTLEISPTPTTTPTMPVLTPTNTITPIKTPTPELTAVLTATPTPSFSKGSVYINEVYPHPENDEDEWVEIYNSNNFTVALINWYIDDISNSGGSPKSFTAIIGPYSYYVIGGLNDFFNNSSDDVRLLDQNKDEMDKFSYSSTEEGESWSKENETWCLARPTKGTVNVNCIESPLPTNTPFSTRTPTPVPSAYVTPDHFSTPTLTPTPSTAIEPTLNKEATNEGEVLGIKSDDNNHSNILQETFSKKNYKLTAAILIIIGIALISLPFIPKKKIIKPSEEKLFSDPENNLQED